MFCMNYEKAKFRKNAFLENNFASTASEKQ